MSKTIKNQEKKIVIIKIHNHKLEKRKTKTSSNFIRCIDNLFGVSFRFAFPLF